MTTKYLAFQGEDSEEISQGLWYCKKLHLWWKADIVYDELSASHNGLIGLGATLWQEIQNSNKLLDKEE